MRTWSCTRDPAADGLPANHSHGTGADNVLKPVGLFTTSPTCSAHSDTHLMRCFSPVGCPYANPNCTSDLICRGLSYREHTCSNTPPSWENGISAQSTIFSWELSNHLLSLKRWNHGLVKKANWHLCLFIKSTVWLNGSMSIVTTLFYPGPDLPMMDSNLSVFDLLNPWTLLTWAPNSQLLPSLVSQGFLFCWIDANLSHCSLYPYDRYSGQHTLTTWQWVLAPTRARRPAIGSCKSHHCDFYFQTPVINNLLSQQLRVNPQRRPGILIHRVLYQRTRNMFPNVWPGCRE